MLARAAQCVEVADLAGLQTTLDTAAEYFNTSFQLAVRWGPNASEAVAYASGASDRRTGKRMAVDDKIPLGSATKPWTAVSALRLAANGIVDLDAPAAPLVDAMLPGNDTLVGYYGPRAANITLRHLLGMRSGVQDYDDGLFRAKVLGNASFDYEPSAIVADANHSLLCDPGTCGAYSSVGYILAGLAVARAAGAETWRGLDQKAAAVGGGAAAFADTIFPQDGSCAEYGTIRQYAPYVDAKNRRYGLYDIADDSCLNGWTCGNVATSARDLAAFWFSLRAGEIVDGASLEEMFAFKPLTTGWSVGLEYGLGSMASGFRSTDGKYDENATLYGHGGEDYGSLTEINGFNPRLNFSVTLAMGSAIGLNCSIPAEANFDAKGAAACYVYDAVLRAVSPGSSRLDCGGHRRRRALGGVGADWTCVPGGP